MKKRFIAFLLSLVLIVVLVQAYFFLQKPPSSEAIYQTIEIEPGATFLAVARLLKQEGLIISPVSFRFLGKITKNESKIKPGEYRLHRAMRPGEILETLVRGDVLKHRVVIPEGTAIREIGKILEGAGLMTAEVFNQTARNQELIQRLGFEGESLEGYLFPDTYHFTKQTPPEQFIEMMTKQFQSVYDDTFAAQAEKLGMTRREVVTLASIIEKETGAPSERALISGVFHNRLKRKMRLQSDPTVIFSLADFDGDIRSKDLQNDSPYNTYRVAGLPPGPITNPGREAIFAALFPAEVDYLFFVSKNNGEHVFSETLREHNAAVRKYQLKENDEAMCRACGDGDG